MVPQEINAVVTDPTDPSHRAGHRLVHKTQSRGYIAGAHANGCESNQREADQIAVIPRPSGTQRFFKVFGRGRS